jgi:hypothetical protein
MKEEEQDFWLCDGKGGAYPVKDNKEDQKKE